MVNVMENSILNDWMITFIGINGWLVDNEIYPKKWMGLFIYVYIGLYPKMDGKSNIPLTWMVWNGLVRFVCVLFNGMNLPKSLVSGCMYGVSGCFHRVPKNGWLMSWKIP